MKQEEIEERVLPEFPIDVQRDILDIINDTPSLVKLGDKEYRVVGTLDNTDCIKLLIAAGANINATDKDGNTPLHWAADGGRLANTRLLISMGANPNATNNKGRTPLDVAKVRQQNSSNTADEFKNNLQLTIDVLEKVTKY